MGNTRGPRVVLEAVASFSKPFCRHLSPKPDKISSKSAFQTPPRRVLRGHLDRYGADDACESGHALRQRGAVVHPSPLSLSLSFTVPLSRTHFLSATHTLSLSISLSHSLTQMTVGYLDRYGAEDGCMQHPHLRRPQACTTPLHLSKQAKRP